MTQPLTPLAEISPSSYTAAGTTILATVSVMNRPEYHGIPTGIANLTEITPRIICSRVPSGILPFGIAVSACETVHNGDGANATNAYTDLSYEWDFGDPNGTEYETDHWNGQTINLNKQYSPEATYLYRNAGTYTITLTVRGMDTLGNIITATTTTLHVLGEYYVHLGASTANTYTLSFQLGSGSVETTTALAHDATGADQLAALLALPSLDSTNCRISYYDVIQFKGNLTGQTYTFSGDFSAITQTSGLENTPRILVEETPAVFTGVVVDEMEPTITIRYFDNNYDGSAGASDGTLTRPYTTYAQVKSWWQGNENRGIAQFWDSVCEMNSQLEFPDTPNHSHMRWFAYGTGTNRPILRQTADNAYIHPRLGSGQSSLADGKMIEDVCFSGIDIVFAGGSNWNTFFPLRVPQSNPGAYPHTRAKNFVWDVKWSVDLPLIGGTDLPVARFMSTGQTGPEKGGTLFSRCHIWKPDFNGTNAKHLALLVTGQGEWYTVTGGHLRGGGDPLNFSLDHLIYPTLTKHGVYKYIQFGSAWKNFCINNNAHPVGGRHEHFVFDGCLFTGCQNGIDMSNTSNSWSATNAGYFDKVVFQFNNMHSGELTSERIGIYSSNMDAIAIRWNRFWGNTQSNIIFKDIADYPWAPNLKFWHNYFRDGKIEIRGVGSFLQTPYFHYNTIDARSGAPCIRFYNSTETVIDQWDADHNIFYTDQTSPFDQGVTWASWQAAGNDLNGQNADPNWSDPTNGIFIKNLFVAADWPDGFTNKEYSLDGNTWSAYTDDTEIILAAGISERTLIYFRAHTPAPVTGVKTIEFLCGAESLSEIDQSVNGTVNAFETRVYLLLRSSAGILILCQEA